MYPKPTEPEGDGQWILATWVSATCLRSEVLKFEDLECMTRGVFLYGFLSGLLKEQGPKPLDPHIRVRMRLRASGLSVLDAWREMAFAPGLDGLKRCRLSGFRA